MIRFIVEKDGVQHKLKFQFDETKYESNGEIAAFLFHGHLYSSLQEEELAKFLGVEILEGMKKIDGLMKKA